MHMKYQSTKMSKGGNVPSGSFKSAGARVHETRLAGGGCPKGSVAKKPGKRK